MFIRLIGPRYLRYRPISWVSVVGVVVGMAVLFVIDSVMNGFIKEQRRVLRGRTSDIVIIPGETARLNAPSLRTEIAEVEAALSGIPEISGMAPRLNRPAIFAPSKTHVFDTISMSQFGKYNMLQLVGVDLDLENQVSDFEQYLTQTADELSRVTDPKDPFRIDPSRLHNDYRNMVDGLMPLIMGERIFDFFAFRPYEVIKFNTFSDDMNLDDFEPISSKFVIVGTFKTDDYKFDMASGFVPISKFREFLGTKTEAHEIGVALHESSDLDVTKRVIQERLSLASLPALVQTWEDRERVMLDAVHNERAILTWLLVLVILVAALLVFATLSMMVTEKTRDIGILSTLGATQAGIAQLFLTCGLLICTVGTIFGLALGYLVTSNINLIRLFLEEQLKIVIFKPQVYVFTEIPAEVDIQRILFFVVMIFLLSFSASVIPSVRASRFNPVRALRYE